jgi:tetratricopeptide (TPR) repeat protein
VSELLERGSRRLAQGLADEPQLRATLHLELARIHSALGASAEALGHARQAQALFSELDAGNRPEALDAAYIAMETLKEEGQYAQAVQAAEQLRQRAQQAHGPLNRWRLPLAEQLAWMANQQGDARRAEALVREALQTRQDGDALARLRLRSVLGSALLDQARLVEGRGHLRARHRRGGDAAAVRTQRPVRRPLQPGAGPLSARPDRAGRAPAARAGARARGLAGPRARPRAQVAQSVGAGRWRCWGARWRRWRCSATPWPPPRPARPLTRASWPCSV